MSGGYNTIGTHEMDPMIERVLLLKQEAFVYKIPPAQVCICFLNHEIFCDFTSLLPNDIYFDKF